MMQPGPRGFPDVGQLAQCEVLGECVDVMSEMLGRDVQPALVIGRLYVTERDSAPVQYNGIV